MIAGIENNHWPITLEHRADAVAAMIEILEKSSDEGLRIRACRILIAMDGQNMAWRKIESDSLRNEILQLLNDRMAANDVAA